MKTGEHNKANVKWTIRSQGISWEEAHGAIFMDIREELRAQTVALEQMAMRLNCHETLSIPSILRRISFNTAKPKRQKRKVSRAAR